MIGPLKQIEIKCEYCGMSLGIAFIEKYPDEIPITYCSVEHSEAHAAKLVERGMEIVKRLLDEKRKDV